MLSRRWRILGLALVAMPAFVLASRPRVNPPVEPARAIEAHVRTPLDIQRVLRRSCYDCHSNETRWPWYGRVPPLAGLLRRDVSTARAAMNFSDWPEGKKRLAAGSLLAICSATRTGKMPKRAYVLLHPKARVSRAEAERVCEWSNAEAKRLLREARR